MDKPTAAAPTWPYPHRTMEEVAKDEVTIVLPWPNKRLSPNARLHWAAKANVKKSARGDAIVLTKSTKGYQAAKSRLGGDDPVEVEIRFYPPDKRRRDDDNMIGSFKAARDGIAEALGVDDRRFRPHYIFEEPAKPGRIEFRIK